MLSHFFQAPARIREIRSNPSAALIEGFADYLFENGYSEGWLAGYGYRCTEGSLQVSGGCYTMTVHRTKSEARTAAHQHAYSFRNTVLTMGGCTFETLPVIRQVIVGGAE